MSIKVAFVLPSFAGGGAERVLLQLASNIDSSVFSSNLIMLNSDGPYAHMVPSSISIENIDRSRLRYAMPALIRKLRRQKFNVVVSSLGYVNLAILASRKFLPSSTKIIVREANMPSLSLPNGPRPRLMLWLYRHYYSRADVVVCTSRLMMNEMEEYIGVERSRLSLLSNPVDLERVRKNISISPRLKKDKIYFVASGRFTRQKGFDRLLEMFSALPANYYLNILGDGPDRRLLELKIDKFELADRVSMPGFKENPWVYYAEADVFLMPSRWEGLPNAALEALACGTPVIATPESGALIEVAEKTPTGAITIASWGQPFASAMEKVVGNEKIQDLSASLLPENYELSKVRQNFETMVKRLL